MANRQKIDTILRKRELVQAAAASMGGQQQLVDAMNAITRLDGRKTHKTDVSRWINEDRMVSVWDAINMQIATRGAVTCSDFYPTFNEAYKTAKRYRGKALKAAA